MSWDRSGESGAGRPSGAVNDALRKTWPRAILVRRAPRDSVDASRDWAHALHIFYREPLSDERLGDEPPVEGYAHAQRFALTPPDRRADALGELFAQPDASHA
jgi:hypothetical protein